MDTPAPQPDAALNSLSLQNVPTLPKLDKSHFIDSYLQGQKVHARTYATEGQALLSSLDRHNPSPDKRILPTPVQVQHYGFGTPVLKPRVARLKEELPTVAITEDREEPQKSQKNLQRKLLPHISEIGVKSTLSEQRSNDKRMSRTIVPQADTKAKPSSSKKRAISSDFDEDQAARFVARRERKRAKRAILQPADDSESSDEMTLAEAKGNRKPKGKDEKNSKVAAGFALMHGFSATNIGKNRLTMRPPPTVGVFNKGKASIRTHVTNKKASAKKGQRSNQFSELGFLNKTRKESPKKRKKQISLLSSELGSHTSAISDSRSPQIIPKKFLITNRDSSKPQAPKKEADAKAKRTDHSDNQDDSDLSTQEDPSVTPKQRKVAMAESEVWDIELEDHISTAEVASTPADTNVRQGTIILDTRPLQWVGHLDLPSTELVRFNDGETMAAAAAGKCAIDVIHSSPSLGPSQSASQCGQAVHLRLNMPPALSAVRAVSKYFPHAVTKPVNDMPIAGKLLIDSVAVSLRLPEPVGDSPQSGARDGTDASDEAGVVVLERNLPPASSPDSFVNQIMEETPISSLPSQKLQHFARVSPTSSFQLASEDYETEELCMDIAMNVDGDCEVFATGFGQYDLSFEAALSTGDDGCVEVCYDDPYPHLRDGGCSDRYGHPFEDVDLNEPYDEGESDPPYDWQEWDDAMGHFTEDPGSYLDDHLEGWEVEEGNEYEDDLAALEYLDGSEEQLEHPDNMKYVGFYELDGDEDQEFGAVDLGYVDLGNPEPKTSGGLEGEIYQFDYGRHQCASNSTSRLGDSGDASIVLTQRFTQGRALLLGISGQNDGDNFASRKFSLVSCAEADVAKSLKAHWLPQRL